MKQKNKKGSALLLATILLFVVLSMVISLTYVTVMEQKMSSKTKSSVGSFFNAESGVEWSLNKLTNNTGILSAVFSSNSDGSVNCPFPGDVCKVYLLKTGEAGETVITQAEFPNLTVADVKAVRSVGSQGGETQRAIEAAVAAGGGGCYVSYGPPPGVKDSSGKCLQGFNNKGSAGIWGFCCNGGVCAFSPANDGSSRCVVTHAFLPPFPVAGEAFVCCL